VQCGHCRGAPGKHEAYFADYLLDIAWALTAGCWAPSMGCRARGTKRGMRQCWCKPERRPAARTSRRCQWTALAGMGRCCGHALCCDCPGGRRPLAAREGMRIAPRGVPALEVQLYGKKRRGKGSKYSRSVTKPGWQCPPCEPALVNAEPLGHDHVVPLQHGGTDDTADL
jgi:hypothetical protein